MSEQIELIPAKKPLSFEVILNIETDLEHISKADWEFMKTTFDHRSKAFVRDLFETTGVELPALLNVAGRIRMVLVP